MTAKHTQGPWVYETEDNIICCANGQMIFEWTARSANVSIEERNANARLIAAAPELLEALKAQEELSKVGIINAADGQIERVAELRRAAIAKATASNAPTI